MRTTKSSNQPKLPVTAGKNDRHTTVTQNFSDRKGQNSPNVYIRDCHINVAILGDFHATINAICCSDHAMPKICKHVLQIQRKGLSP